MTSIIIDDEKESHEILRRMLSKNHPEIELLGGGENVKDGIALIKELDPDLVFLDIEMPDGSGFDLLKSFGQHDFQVIFITAFNKYAVTAIRFGAIDYLLKPILKEELARSIATASERKVEFLSPQQFEILLETLQKVKLQKLPTRIAISTSNGVHYKLVRNIIRLEAKQNYTEFVLKEDDLGDCKKVKKILASVHLKKYEEQFELYEAFMRVHRSHLVNLEWVDKYMRGEGGYLVMKDGALVKVSNPFKDDLLRRLEGL